MQKIENNKQLISLPVYLAKFFKETNNLSEAVRYYKIALELIQQQQTKDSKKKYLDDLKLELQKQLDILQKQIQNSKQFKMLVVASLLTLGSALIASRFLLMRK